MSKYTVIYTQNFIPNDWHEGNFLISDVKFDIVEADSEEEAKKKAQEQVSKKNRKDEKGCIENRVSSVEIIK